MSSVPNLSSQNSLELTDVLFQCCGCTRWAKQLATKFPFSSFDLLLARAEEIWFGLEKEDWLEAFSHHPKIGDLDSLRKKFSNTAKFTSNEQAKVKGASEDILGELAQKNGQYANRFGYIFIICASGKSASEMLNALKQRLGNNPDTELKIAAKEQNKITKLRLKKLFGGSQ